MYFFEKFSVFIFLDYFIFHILFKFCAIFLVCGFLESNIWDQEFLVFRNIFCRCFRRYNFCFVFFFRDLLAMYTNWDSFVFMVNLRYCLTKNLSNYNFVEFDTKIFYYNFVNFLPFSVMLFHPMAARFCHISIKALVKYEGGFMAERRCPQNS